MAFVGDNFYAEVTIDGKFNFVDHLTGRIIESANISDVYNRFEVEKAIELDKIKQTESIPLEIL